MFDRQHVALVFAVAASVAAIVPGRVASAEDLAAARADDAAGVNEGARSALTSKPAPKLHRNPFERPESLRLPITRATEPVQAVQPWTPVLRATMVSNDGPSLANVNGEIVEKGSLYQGFKLVEVREREAVFERGGNRWVLRLD